MTPRTIKLLAPSKKLFLLALPLLIGLAMCVGAWAQVLTPPPTELRFQLLLNEPIAAPDRRSVVAGTAALLVKDRRSGQCYVAVTIGGAAAMTPAACAE